MVIGSEFDCLRRSMLDVCLLGRRPQVRITGRKCFRSRGILPCGPDPLSVAVSSPQTPAIPSPMHEQSRCGSDGSRPVRRSPEFYAAIVLKKWARSLRAACGIGSSDCNALISGSRSPCSAASIAVVQRGKISKPIIGRARHRRSPTAMFGT